MLSRAAGPSARALVGQSSRATTAAARVLLPAFLAPSCVPSRSSLPLPPLHRSFTQSAVQRYADATTPHSTISDPAELEAQKALEEGTHALERGDWEEAKKAYERSNSIKESSSSHFNLGVVHFQTSDLPASIASFQRSLSLSPQSSDTHTNLASAYVMSSPARPDLAVEHLQKAVEIDRAAGPGAEDGEVWFNLGAVLEACERLEESVKAYEKARELGIERAGMNLRNVTAKILAVKVGAKQEAQPEESKAGEEGKGKGERK